MVNILVTGGKGQLGESIKSVAHLPGYNFIYKGALELDITDKEGVISFFDKHKIDWCVNCAAYTAVDKAEMDVETATKINTLGPEILAQVCNEFQTKLIHISTDFVFDGKANEPYTETSLPNPISVYGVTKLEGERRIISKLKTYFILRTSWLYSEFGNNFMKTMIRLASERDQLNVVNDQIGSPTYARDLALIIIEIIKTNSDRYGIYNYSNQGIASWYDFAVAIFDIANISITVNPIPTEDYPTPALRPSYSVLDTTKIKQNLNVNPPYWRDSLSICLHHIIPKAQ